MGVCEPFGFPAYNPVDLLPEGYVTPQIERIYSKEEPPPEARLNNPLAGQTFTELEDGRILERRKLLPAGSLFYELQYRSTVKSNNETLGQSGAFLGFGFAGGLVQSLANQTVLGGISIAKAHFTLQQIDGLTEVNIPIRITQDILDTQIKIKPDDSDEEITVGTVSFKNFPASVLAVTDDKLFFTNSQRAGIGEAGRPNGISGTTNANGQFDGDIVDELFADFNIEGVSGGPFSSKEVSEIIQENNEITEDNVSIVGESKERSRETFNSVNRFVRIIKDPRILRFRSDSGSINFSNALFSIPGQEAAQEFLVAGEEGISSFFFDSGAGGSAVVEAEATNFGFTITSPERFHDLTSNRIQIKLNGLELDDVVFITASFATNRRLRQNIETRGTIFEGANRVGIALSEIVAIPEAKAWNYKIVNWRVPKDANKDKVDISSTFSEGSNQESSDLVSGWRLTELIDTDQKDFFAADRRGIIIKKQSGEDEVLIAADQIRDQNWFNNFLKENNLINNLYSDVFPDKPAGSMFDVSEAINSALFDQEKLPYHRPLALALNKVSEFNISDSTSGVGIANLDLTVSDIEAPSTLDLSSAVFIDGKQSSVFPSSFSGKSCTSTQNFGSFRDPNFPGTLFSLFIPQPAPDVQTDWNLVSPIFTDEYTQFSRLYVERYAPDRTDQNSRRMSLLFVSPFATSEASLSLDETFDRENVFVFFESDTDEAISYHKLSTTDLKEQINNLTLFKQASHERPDFDHNNHDVVGYNFLLGDSPSYSKGRIPSTEFLEICSGRLSRRELFNIVDDNTFSLQSNETIKELNIPDGFGVRDIILEYSINKEELPENRTEGIDNRISFQFGEEGPVINNTFLPIGNEKGEVDLTATFDGQLYSGSPLKIESNIFNKTVTLKSIKTVGIREDKLEGLKIKGVQTATAIDSKNRLFVFYHDPESKNISVAASSVGGASSKWFINTDIIRLVEGETADIPYIISDKKTDLFYLFYRLNNSFLMVKTIDPNNITCEDIGVIYEPPSSYTESSDENLALEEYSEKGKILRKSVSYFIIGDAEDSFFSTEIDISNQRIENVKNTDDDPAIRFAFRGILSQMDIGFQNGSYAVYKDSKASYRVLFVLEDGRLYAKRSPNLQEWFFDFRKAIFHKNFDGESIEDSDLTISNPQVVYDELTDFLYVTYFHSNGLYMRTFSNDSLFPLTTNLELNTEGEGESQFISENIRSEIELTKDSNSFPFFLVGSFSEDLLSSINNNDSSLLVRVIYDREIRNRFATDDFIVDSAAKPAGFVTGQGLLRILYKIPTGEIYGVTINSNRPTLDVLLRETGVNPQNDN